MLTRLDVRHALGAALVLGVQACVGTAPRSTPLLSALEGGDSKEALALIEQGEWNELRNMAQEAPVHVAARRGHREAIEALLEAGVDIDSPGGRYDWTPLCYAVDEGDLATARFLTDVGASISAVNANGVSALHAGAAAGRPEMMEFLLDHEVVVDQATALGESPLTWACAHEQGSPARRAELVSVLLRSGADPNLVDATGRTPVHFAAVRSNAQLLDLLLEAGGAPGGSGEDEIDPIHAAAVAGLRTNVRRLLVEDPRPVLLAERHEVNAITYRMVAEIHEADGDFLAALDAYETAASQYTAQAELLSQRASAKELEESILLVLAVVAAGYIQEGGTKAMLRGDSTSPFISQAAILDMQTLQGAGELSESRRPKWDSEQIRLNAELLSESARDCNERARALETRN